MQKIAVKNDRNKIAVEICLPQEAILIVFNRQILVDEIFIGTRIVQMVRVAGQMFCFPNGFICHVQL